MNANLERLPNSIDQLYEMGMRHYRRREWRAAAECFRRIKELDPNRSGIDGILSEVGIFLQLEAMTPDRVRETTDDNVGLDQPGTPAVSTLASVARRLLLSLIVLIVLVSVGLVGAQMILDSSARDIEALKNLVDAQIISRNYAGARDTCTRILGIDPQNRFGQDCLGRIQIAEIINDLDTQAAAAIQQKEWDQAQALLNRILEQDPGNSKAKTDLQFVESQQEVSQLFAAGEAFFNINQWSEARQKFEEVRTKAPNFRPTQVHDYLFRAYLNEGLALINGPQDTQTSIATAVDRFASATALEPANTQAQDERRRADYYLEAYNALEEEPIEPQRTINIAQLLLSEEANYANGKLRELLYRAYLLLGDRLVETKSYLQALQAYDSARRLGVRDASDAEEKYNVVALQVATATPTATLVPTATPTATPAPTRRPATRVPLPPVRPPTWTPAPVFPTAIAEPTLVPPTEAPEVVEPSATPTLPPPPPPTQEEEPEPRDPDPTQEPPKPTPIR